MRGLSPTWIISSSYTYIRIEPKYSCSIESISISEVRRFFSEKQIRLTFWLAKFQTCIFIARPLSWMLDSLGGLVLEGHFPLFLICSCYLLFPLGYLALRAVVLHLWKGSVLYCLSTSLYPWRPWHCIQAPWTLQANLTGCLAAWLGRCLVSVSIFWR